MKARAAGAGAPRATSRPATGTLLHSQPGTSTPASPATGTATDARRENTRARHPAGTKAAMAPLTRTPSTRKGRA